MNNGDGNEKVCFLKRHPVLVLTATALLLVLPFLILTDIPPRDVAVRYAPMAQAFAEGDWGIAFHPRVPPLSSVLGGCVVFLLGCGAFTALKLLSAASYILSVLPLWGILHRVFDRRIAFWGCLFYVFCSHLLRLSASGLREPGKGLFLLLAIYALIRIYRERNRLRFYLLFGAAVASMSLIRDDSIVFAMLLGIGVLAQEIARYRLFFWRTLLAGALVLAIFSPWLCYNYGAIGYPVPGIRAARAVTGWLPAYCFGKMESFSIPGEAQIAPPPDVPRKESYGGPAVKVPQASPALPEVAEDDDEMADFLDSLVKGVYYLFFIPAMLMVCRRIMRRTWTVEETILLAVFLGHTLLVVLQILLVDHKLYVSRRYLIAAAPLCFGWTAMALFWIHRKLGEMVSPRTCKVIFYSFCIAAGLGLYADGLGPLIKQYGGSKHLLARDAARKWAVLIREDYSGIRRAAGNRMNPSVYRTFALPLISCRDLLVLGYLSGGEGVAFTPEESCDRKQPADYMAGEYRSSEPIPEFSGYEILDVMEKYNRRYILWRRTSGQ